MIRIFVGVSIPRQFEGPILALQERLRELGIEARYPKPDSLHLTLKFLGDVDEAVLPKIGNQLEEVARLGQPFSARLAGFGVFPHLSDPRVVWLGIESGEPLFELQQQIELELEGLGFSREKRPFRPHLTLARIKSRRRMAGLIHLLEIESEKIELGEFQVVEFSIFRSVLRPQGALYTRLMSFVLG